MEYIIINNPILLSNLRKGVYSSRGSPYVKWKQTNHESLNLQPISYPLLHLDKCQLDRDAPLTTYRVQTEA